MKSDGFFWFFRGFNYIFIKGEGGGVHWSNDLNSHITNESRALGFFLGQYLKQDKVKGLGFDGLYYKGVLTEKDRKIEIINRLLGIPIKMLDKDYPKEKDPKEVYEYLITHIYKGNQKIAKEYPLIVKVVEEGIEIFRKNNYEYTWISKKKRITGKGITAKLVGHININRFILTLEFEYKNGEFISKPILETPPNEYSFKHRFKDILIDGATVKITDRFDKVWYEYPIPPSSAKKA
ncbi:MAG: Unknown protein [uncultured Sulfurovum sp.]|uniref:Uncharacterized protein n=1 Tax=uncultured Sulfurovum sp. TaxID=269237 RepID=A0A6S6TVI4_9BACT|nr:MAG: Unknown protein [uncultured Sulfurovum sp.]